MKHKKPDPGGLSLRKSGSSSRGVSGAGSGSSMAAIRNPDMVKALIIAGSGRRTEPRRHQPREHAVSRQAAAQGTPPRATYVPAQRLATVTHGQVGANDQEQRSRRSSARLGDRTSKLVMRVRFPSSAPSSAPISSELTGCLDVL